MPIVAASTALQSQIKNSLSLGMMATPDSFATAITTALDMGATPDSVSASLATAIVSLVPMVPPAAQSALQVQLKNALTLDMGATPDSVATIMATAIIAYYTAAGAI